MEIDLIGIRDVICLWVFDSNQDGKIQSRGWINNCVR